LIGLSDALLLNLPIFERSDGTIGDAKEVFYRADWHVPEALGDRVVTVRLSDNSRVQEKQRALLPVWTPQKQVEVIMSLPNPHSMQRDIFEAITEISKAEARLDDSVLKRLRTVSWLDVDGVPKAPEKFLTLPSGVEEVAGEVLKTCQ